MEVYLRSILGESKIPKPI